MRSGRHRLTGISRILFLVSLMGLLWGISSADADQVTESEVRRAVETWVRTVTADARPDASVTEMEPHQADGQTVAYIAHLSGGGFCLCGADDLVLPVYFYSPTGTYHSQSPNYRCILLEIGERTRKLQEGFQKGDSELRSFRNALSDRAAFWLDLSNGRVPRRLQGPKEESTDVEPDLLTLDVTSHWHQGSPYNDQCPELATGERTQVGPVATAMAQIMYYWRWPRRGEGSASVAYQYRWRSDWDESPLSSDPSIPEDPLWEDRLDWTPDDDGQLLMKGYWDESLYLAARAINTDSTYREALKNLWDALNRVSAAQAGDFSGDSYDWGIMEDDHTDPPDAGAAEAARLCYDIGVATETDFGLLESNTTAHKAKYAFRDHFRYDDDVKEMPNNIASMTEELTWYRPIAFTAEDPDHNEHAWVVYGYNKGTDPDRQFLVNMGWGGEDDGWYTCDEIDYYLNQLQVYQIAPEEVVQFVYQGDGKLKKDSDGSPDNPYTDIDEALATVPDSATLIFRAGTNMPLTSDTLVIDRPMVLKGKMILGEQQK